MDNLRWVLLGLGVIIVLGIYLFSKRRSGDTEQRTEPGLGGETAYRDPTDDLVSPVRIRPADEVSMDQPAPASSAPEEASDRRQQAAKGPHWPDPDSSWWHENRVAESKPSDPETGLPVTEPGTAGVASAAPGPGSQAAISAPVTAPTGEPQDDLLLTLHITARADSVLTGPAIAKALQGSGLELGSTGIFEYQDARGNGLFYVSNMFNPGVFYPDQLAETSTRGLTFFSQLPGAVSGAEIFNRMSTIAQKVATQLGANLLDEERTVYADPCAQRIKQKIAAFEQGQ